MKSYKLKNGKKINLKTVRRYEKNGYSDAVIAGKLNLYPQQLSTIRKKMNWPKKYPTTIGAKSGRPHGYREFCESKLLAYRKDVDESKLTPFERRLYENIKEQRGW